MAPVLHDHGVLCEPDSREPWFICEAHAQGDIVDQVLTSFSDSLDAALEARARGDRDQGGSGAMAHPTAG